MKNFLGKNKVLGLILLSLMLLGVVTPLIIKGHERGFLSRLTEEQRRTIQDKVSKLREAGISHEEIRAEVAKILEGYGVEMPEEMGGRRDRRSFMVELSEEQRKTVREKVTEMREAGISREEIRNAIAKMLEDYGIEMPEEKARGGDQRTFLAELSEEQRDAIREKIKEMQGSGATREKIHSEVAEMLESYGVEIPEDFKGMWFGRRRFMESLNDEQREAIHEKIREMRIENATREEIHTAVSELLESYGIELSEEKFVRFGRMRITEKLTDEQREAIHKQIEELKNREATKEEIRAAIKEMLKEYGVELPENRSEIHGRRIFMELLSEEERKSIREEVSRLRESGATHKEIKSSVTEMLRGYGIVYNPESADASSESVSKSVTSEDETFQKGSSGLRILEVYPNYEGGANITYALDAESNVEIQIYDAVGRLIEKLDIGIQEPGTYSVKWNGNVLHLASGIYLCRIKAGNKAVSKKMVIFQ